MFGIRAHYVCAYHAESNGVLERKHGFLKAVLRSYCHDRAEDWPEYLAAALFVVNNCPMASTLGHSPSFMLFGVNLRDPLEAKLSLPEHNVPSSTREHLEALLTNLEVARRDATKALDRAEKRLEDRWKRFKRKPVLQVGTICYLYRPALDVKSPKALRFNYIGPYYCVEKVTDNVYRVRDLKTHRLVKEPIHLNHLVPVLIREDRPVDTKIPGNFDPTLPAPVLMEDEIPPDDLIEADIDVVGPPSNDRDAQAQEESDEEDDETASITAKVGTPRSEISSGREHTESEMDREVEGGEQEMGSRESSKLETLQRSRPVPSVKSVPPRRSKRRRQKKIDKDFVEGSEISRLEEKSEEAYQEIIKIHRGRHKDGNLQYLVTWADGTKSWVNYNQLNQVAVKELEKQQIPVAGKPRIRQR